ncbi:M48 family metalloprotease [Microbispora sp. CA-135349]|uniref:M48 family metalloprotease n=1 Tax=Microbispora sp. CA-135349 TaxID=3239953 RepID=UPI003D8A0464
MGSMVAPPRIDERSMVAGTTVRFTLLLVLLLVSSGSMMQSVINRLYGADNYGCLLAAGGDPNQGIQSYAARITRYFAAVQTCRDRFEPEAPLWLTLLWPALLVTATVVLFRCLPRWKARRGRFVPLEAIDHDGEIRRRLADFAAVAGLDRLPRVVVDPAAASTSAVVFGSNRRPIVCLHGGLLARMSTDPTAFRAVALHEFAHVRNGDVTLTYTTIAVWRVFIGLVLLSYVVWELSDIPASARSRFWPVTHRMRRVSCCLWSSWSRWSISPAPTCCATGRSTRTSPRCAGARIRAAGRSPHPAGPRADCAGHSASSSKCGAPIRAGSCAGTL